MAFSFRAADRARGAHAPPAGGNDHRLGNGLERDRAAGSSCLAEKRVIEKLDLGEARTPFLMFGDRVEMEARFADGRARTVRAHRPKGRWDAVTQAISTRLGMAEDLSEAECASLLPAPRAFSAGASARPSLRALGRT